MKLNKEHIKSVMESAKTKFGNELSDELLEAINGGRDIRPIEHLIIVQHERAAFSKKDDELYEYCQALEKYFDYIHSLPDDSDTKLFVQEEWS